MPRSKSGRHATRFPPTGLGCSRPARTRRRSRPSSGRRARRSRRPRTRLARRPSRHRTSSRPRSGPTADRAGAAPVAELTYRAAVASGIAQEMARDETVVLIGEDVGAAGGVFKTTEGLLEKFGPERVRDTPISEQAIV